MDAKHGHAGNQKSPTYKTWRGMKTRCTNPGNASYKNYGAKGISYCKRWETFANFLEDMGVRPEGMTLDRIDRTKDYGPNNCRWANRREQTLDRGCTVWIEYQGRTQCLTDWALELNLNLTTLKERLKQNWSIEKAFTTPPRPYRRRRPQQAS